MFKINKVEKPKAVRVGFGGSVSKYPFLQLEVGDMFFVPGKEKNNMSSYVSGQSKKLGRNFSTQLCWMRDVTGEGDWETAKAGDEGAVLGVGVWRDADDAPRRQRKAA